MFQNQALPRRGRFWKCEEKYVEDKRNDHLGNWCFIISGLAKCFCVIVKKRQVALVQFLAIFLGMQLKKASKKTRVSPLGKQLEI